MGVTRTQTVAIASACQMGVTRTQTVHISSGCRMGVTRTQTVAIASACRMEVTRSQTAHTINACRTEVTHILGRFDVDVGAWVVLTRAGYRSDAATRLLTCPRMAIGQR